MNNSQEVSNYHIPGKQEVFEALVSGMHISLHSGELYRYLQEHIDSYTDEFKTFGYTLVSEGDYFYLQGQTEQKANEYSHRCLVFIAIMLESIANKGGDIVETLFHSSGFERDQLPHLSTERYRNYMHHLEISDEKKLNTHLKRMHRSGFINYVEAENFVHFLSPCQRFLHLSLEILEQHQQESLEDTG